MNGSLDKHPIVRHPKAFCESAALRDHADRPAIGGDTSNQITDFHLITFKSLARYLRSGIGGLPTSLTT
jgi:hypothetical protein